MVLDVMLPDGTGFELLREIRSRGNTVPVLMLTSPLNIVEGLDSGADDYLTKPFVVTILKARVRALLRRGGAKRGEALEVGDLKMDRLTRTVTCGGKRISLTPKEYTLLEYFMLHPERVVTRTVLLEKVWDLHFDPGSNVVDTHVARLRSKLERSRLNARIATVRGAGFMLERGDSAFL